MNFAGRVEKVGRKLCSRFDHLGKCKRSDHIGVGFCLSRRGEAEGSQGREKDWAYVPVADYGPPDGHKRYCGLHPIVIGGATPRGLWRRRPRNGARYHRGYLLKMAFLVR